MQHLRIPPRLLIRAAALGALLVGVAPAAASQESRPGPKPTELAEVRAVFGRVDADGDGKLGLREADHGGVGAEDFARFDANADGALDPEEYVVARHALLDAAGESSAADLRAEATRIQAAWRARRALERDRGPSASRTRAGVVATSGAGPTPAPAERPPAGKLKHEATTPPAYPPEVGGGLPPALGLGRLRKVARAEEGQVGVTLEERARAAQELIEARMRARSERPGDSVVSTTLGPAARRTSTHGVQVVIKPAVPGGTQQRAAAPVPSTGSRATHAPEPAEQKPARPATRQKAPPRASPAPQTPSRGGPAAGRSRSSEVPKRGGGGPR